MSPAFWQDRRVFVTGHTGFKGAWLTLWLTRLGAQVTAYALPPERGSLSTLVGAEIRCESRFGDVRHEADLRDAMHAAAPEVVFHLAAQSLVRRSYRDPVGTFATNLMGTVNCLEAIRTVGSVRAAVVVTSDKCYDNQGVARARREIDAMGGYDPYSSSKGCAELAVAAYRSSFFGAPSACRIATARAGNVIGGGDRSEDRLVPDAIRAFEDGRSVEIRSPHATRPWQHVLDSLHGYLLLAEALGGAAGDRFCEGWNFGPAQAESRPVASIMDGLVRRWGEGAAWHLSADPHPHEAPILAIDSGKAVERLGWAPVLHLEQALDWTVDWHRAARAGQDPAALCLAQIAQYQRSAADTVSARPA